MSNMIAWIKAHKWETTAGVLGVALVAAIGILVVSLGGSSEDPIAISSTTSTTLPEGSSTSLPSTATTLSQQSSGTSTTAAPVEITEGVTAVVVDNVQGVGFQIGLNAADIIIETPVEGGISRFTALYGTELPTLIGPVRSLRPVSADLLAPFTPIVFTTGGQRFVVGSVTGAGATIITPEESIGFQSLERPRPHHVFVSPGEDVPSGVEIEPPWEIGDWTGGDPATTVEIPVSGGVTWEFENGVYTRYIDGEPQQVLAEFDGDPEALTRDTLILLYANEKSAGYTDSAGAEVPTFDVVGGGSLTVYHQGEVIEGTWSRASQAEPYVFVTVGGDSVLVPPSTVQLTVVPQG